MSLPLILQSTCFCLIPIDPVHRVLLAHRLIKMSVEKESLSFELKHVEVSPHSDESDSLITRESNTVYTGDSDLLIDELGSVLSQDNKYMMSKLRSGGHPLLNMMCGFGVETHVLAHFL